MFARANRLLAILLLVFAMQAGVSAPSALAQDAEPMLLETHPEPLLFETDGGRRSFTIEIADDPTERSRGLMYRRSMADDHGMLFVFEAERPVAFWMKNTPMPLDLVFIDETGEVRAVLPGEPFSEAPITPNVPVRFVLELKRGTAAAIGLDPGDTASHPAITAATGK